MATVTQPISSAPRLDPTVKPIQEANVLVVDDSRTMRLVLIRALNGLGFTNITEANDGRQAMDLITQKSFDLMLLDMEMPEMNGMEVLQAVQANPRLKGLPIIVISGAEQIENAVKCIEAGAEDYPQSLLTQPFSVLESLPHSKRSAYAILIASASFNFKRRRSFLKLPKSA